MKTRTACRLCDSAIEVVWNLTPTPLANELLGSREASLAQEKFPLDLAVCVSCGHVQLAQVVEPERLFKHYLYTSSASPVYWRHLNEYTDSLCDRFAPEYMLEIASNDGTMLDMFMKRGVSVLGVEPAKNLAETATMNGLPTKNAFFGEATAKEIDGRFDLIVANHVLAHIDDLGDVVRGVDVLLAPNGTFVFEVGYLGDVLAGAHFDTIYHEHVSYHHLSPLVSFFKRFDMAIFDAQLVDTQGGSMRVFVRRGLQKDLQLPGRLSDEARLALPSEVRKRVADTHTRADAITAKLRRELGDMWAAGVRVAGYGAPAKCVTLLHSIGMVAETLDFVVDDAPLKRNLFIPGNGIEILPPQTLYERKPDVVLVLAWNFAESIMEKHKAFSGRWIVPAP